MIQLRHLLATYCWNVTFLPLRQGLTGEVLEQGPLIGAKVTGVRIVVHDGSSHLVDSSEIAFRLCAEGAAKQGALNSNWFPRRPARLLRLFVEVRRLQGELGVRHLPS